MPSLVGATLRIPYTFMVPSFGGRNWTIVSALLLLIPSDRAGRCASATRTPRSASCCSSRRLAGFGGGNFASSMANITFFYPAREKGWALGLNAAGGNLGAAVAQLVVPIVITLLAAGTLNLPLAGLMWVPLILLAAFGAWKYMDNLTSAKADFAGSLAALKEPHLWIMALLYIGTFGSFIGFAGVFPKLIKDQFPAFSSIGVGTVALSLAFLGALVGSLARPYGGRLADRFGGARMTVAAFAAMAVVALTMIWTLPLGNFWLFLGLFLLLFVASGFGNGSTYRMIPVVFATSSRAARSGASTRGHPAAASAALGLISAIGAYGGFVIPQVLNASNTASGSYTPAFYGFVGAYVVMLAVCWFCYIRQRQPTTRWDTSDMTNERRHALPLLRAAVRHDADVTSGSDPGSAAGARARAGAPPDALPRSWTSPAATSPPTAAACARRAGPRPSLLTTPAASRSPCSGRRRRAPPGQLGRGADADHRRGEADPGPSTGPTPSACSAAAGSPTRRPTSWASSPGWPWAPPASTTTAGSACPRPPRPGSAPSASTAGLPFPLEDLDAASTILMLGSNVAETMPPFVQHLQGARDAGGLIVVDPRRSATAAFTADGGGLHLQPLPGTDLALLLGLAHVVIAEGLADARLHRGRAPPASTALVRSVASWWPERVQSLTGVPAGLIRDTARRLADGARQGGSYILTGRGVEQHVDGTDTATAAINLALLLGLPGSARSGYGTLTGQGNGQGGREHGQKADQLPGYRKITDPAARAHVAAVWGVARSH